MSPLWRQFAGFGLFGAVGTGVHYALLLALVQTGLSPALPASVAGSLAGALCNYLLSRRFVFRSRRAHRQALPRFLAVAGIGFGGNALAMAIGLRLGLHYLLAQILATALVLIWNFAANKRWTFSEPSHVES